MSSLSPHAAAGHGAEEVWRGHRCLFLWGGPLGDIHAGVPAVSIPLKQRAGHGPCSLVQVSVQVQQRGLRHGMPAFLCHSFMYESLFPLCALVHLASYPLFFRHAALSQTMFAARHQPQVVRGYRMGQPHLCPDIMYVRSPCLQVPHRSRSYEMMAKCWSIERPRFSALLGALERECPALSQRSAYSRYLVLGKCNISPSLVSPQKSLPLPDR